MKKVMIALLVLATVFSFVACNSNAVNEQMLTQDTVNVSFAPKLGGDTKAITVDINHAAVSSVYWYYTATKKDGGGTVGATDGKNALAENKSGNTVNAGLNANGHEFSVGTWDFTLYGYLTSQNDSVTVESAEANCAYKATVTGKKLDLSAAKQTISMSASPILTTGTESDAVGKGTLKVTTTHSVTSGDTPYTVKYSIDGGTTWIEKSTDTTTSNDFCGSNKTVTLGLFNNKSTPEKVVEKTITVSLYRGLTTTIGGTWDDPTVIGEFAVTGPWEVTFASCFSDGATVQIVKDGEKATGPTKPSDVSQAGVTYKFMKWTTVEDTRQSPAKAYVFDSMLAKGYDTLTAFDFSNTTIKADTKLNAVWVKTYTVTYDANGATSGAAPAAQTFVCGDDAKLAGNSGELKKTGFVFDGWNTDATGTGTSYTAGDEVKGGLSGGDTTLYAKWTELKRVGGRVFHITNDGNGATYTFFDQNGAEIKNQTVAGLANAYYYLVKGTPTADKFYVYYDDEACWGVTGWWCWSYDGLTPEHVDDNGVDIGTGKAKTEKMLKRNNGAYVASPAGSCNGTMWWWINYMRTNDGGMGGCTDWFVPSEKEVQTLWYSDSRPSWIMSCETLCTCRDWGADGYSMCKCNNGDLEGTGKYDGNRVIAIRSF